VKRNPVTQETILTATVYFILAIVILYTGIWLGRLDSYYINKPIKPSLQLISFYLNDLFVLLIYSLVVIVGIGAIIIIATYRRDIYNAQKEAEVIITRGRLKALQFKKEAEDIKENTTKEAERIVIEAKKAEVLWQRKTEELEEKERELQRKYEIALQDMQSKFNDKVRKKGEENKHLAEKCQKLTDELLKRKIKHLNNLQQNNPERYKREKKRLEQKLKSLT
jgi:hypothetical protein